VSTRADRAHALQGKRAGFASRILAAAIDIGIVFAGYEIILVSIGLARSLLTQKSFELPTPPTWLSGVTLGLLIVLVLAIAWSGSGRTLGDAAIGLRVVTDRGDRIGFLRAVGRATVLVILPIVSMAWIAVSRKNAGLHDLACHTAVIYDWKPRHERGREPVMEAVVPVPVAPAPDPVDSRPI
jgi:uncharacterized RDD family membrane protein YckC